MFWSMGAKDSNEQPWKGRSPILVMAGTGLLKLAQVKGILTVRNQVQGIIL